MQHDLTLKPITSPAPIYRYRDGIYAVELLIVALSELDLFSALAGGSMRTRDLLDRLDVRERPGDVMLTLLVAMGLLERDGDSVGLTALSGEHLTSGSPRFLGPYGYSDRVAVVAANMFEDDWPDDCDARLFSNVIHDWGEVRVRELIERSRRFLRPHGSIIIHDAHINADKTGPLPVAEYSALLMHFTEGKCYSVRELDELLTGAGFTDVGYTPTTAERSIVTARSGD